MHAVSFLISAATVQAVLPFLTLFLEGAVLDSRQTIHCGLRVPSLWKVKRFYFYSTSFSQQVQLLGVFRKKQACESERNRQLDQTWRYDLNLSGSRH